MAGRPLTRMRNGGYGGRTRRNAKAGSTKVEHYILVYDVRNDKTRKRLAYRLQNWFQRVQRSVYEAALTKAELGKVRALIKDTINLNTDTVKLFKGPSQTMVIGKGNDLYKAKKYTATSLLKAKKKAIVANPYRRRRRNTGWY